MLAKGENKMIYEGKSYDIKRVNEYPYKEISELTDEDFDKDGWALLGIKRTGFGDYWNPYFKLVYFNKDKQNNLLKSPDYLQVLSGVYPKKVEPSNYVGVYATYEEIFEDKKKFLLTAPLRKVLLQQIADYPYNIYCTPTNILLDDNFKRSLRKIVDESQTKYGYVARFREARNAMMQTLKNQNESTLNF